MYDTYGSSVRRELSINVAFAADPTLENKFLAYFSIILSPKKRQQRRRFLL